MAELFETQGFQMIQLMTKLFPICRSITGNGVRETLKHISEICPLQIFEVPTGTKAFDWTVPKEWNITDAYIIDASGNKIVDFKKNNLHVVGYSIPVNKLISLAELKVHLYSLPEQPKAIPYITSYYKEWWGFCISHEQMQKLKDETYHVVIDSELTDGSLTYGEIVIKGETEKEIFLSTYICHPSMANNELSGPVVMAFIAKWLRLEKRRYTYRIVFVPETIGSLTYISRNFKEMKNKIIAGFNISCIGDNRTYSYVSSRYGDSLADRVAYNILASKHPDFQRYSFLDRGSDERQYCSPGIDLPLVTLCRSKYGTYPEYHTSLDDLNLVSAEGLMGGYEFVKDCIELIENNYKFKILCYGEPQLGKRGLYPNLSTNASKDLVKTMMDFIAYADGMNDLIEISKIINKPASEMLPIAKALMKSGLVKQVE